MAEKEKNQRLGRRSKAIIAQMFWFHKAKIEIGYKLLAIGW